MAIEKTPMTDQQRKSVVLEYFRRIDRGDDILDLFDEHAEVYVAKLGLARGIDEIRTLFANLGTLFEEISHAAEYLNIVVQGDTVGVEGMSSGRAAGGVPWRGGDTYAGRWCDIFEVRNFRIDRYFSYIDPDYAGADTERYPWLAGTEAAS
jgi:ketosteroid isomerase-like protein